MSLFPSYFVRIRASLVVSMFAILAVSFVWATLQEAATSSGTASHHYSATLSVPEKGSITPQVSVITVNSLSDVANGNDGLCTLREAISSANSNTISGFPAGECVAGSGTGADSIIFTVTGVINMSGGWNDINSDMTITGPGSSQLTVRRDTGGNYKIFTITSGTVAMSGMTITNGRAGDGLATNPVVSSLITDGGAIYNNGTLTLTDIVLTNNRAGNGASWSNVSGFRGGHGGAIANFSNLTMTNCSVTGNTAGAGSSILDGGFGGDGGGVFNSGTLTMSNCTVTGNQAGGGANGGSSLGGNGGSGGGVFNSGTMTLSNCTVNGNQAGNGGPGAPGGNGGNGGGIHSQGSGTTTLNLVTVNNNNTGTGQPSGGSGGGIYNGSSGGFNLNSSSVSNNTCAAGGGGGGIDIESSMFIVASTISGNTDPLGGVLNRRTLVMSNSTVSGNSSMGLNNNDNDSTAMLINCTVTANQSTGVFDFQVATFFQNSIVAGNGGSDVVGACTTIGHNLIGVSGAPCFTNGANGDQVGTPGSPLNAQLAPLADNGGPTLTHALLFTSPALDAGDNCVTVHLGCGNSFVPELTTDQRGVRYSRQVDGPDANTTATVDIGAYETQTILANLADSSTNENTQLVTPFDVWDPSTVTSITATSSNPTLVPNDAAHLAVALKGSTAVVTVNPAANQLGTTNITVTVNRTGGPESKTFMLTVNPVNDAPSFIKGADQVVNEDAETQTIAGWATAVSPGPSDEAGQALTFQVVNNTNAALFSVAPAVSASGTLTYTPASNVNGSAIITINLKDDGGTANGGADTSGAQTFTITVNSVNDPPSFTKGADRTANEDSGSQFVTWATNISPGPNEVGQTLTFTVTNDNNALFSTQPAINSSGTLTFTPAFNANGSANLSVTLKDNGGTANGGVDTSAPQTFTINVIPVNDPPTFTKGPDQTVNEDAGAQTVNNWVTNISAGPPNESSQTLTFLLSNSNGGLFSVAPAVSANGTLTYTPAPDVSGTATVTITLRDSGDTANGGSNASGSFTFFITVRSVNDVPSFSKGANQTVNEDAGARTLANWATSISAGPANESGQTLSFTVTNDNNALFSSPPAVSSTGVLTYTPAANMNGSANMSVVLKDNGGTTNGGVDTSASQTFTITVNAVNDAPSFTKGANQTANNNAGPQTVPNWATNISPGPVDESGQTVAFEVTNTYAPMFAVQPAISPNGTLTYTPNPNDGGTAQVFVTLKDNGGTANGGVDTSASQSFIITVNPIGGFFSFAQVGFLTSESSGSTAITVRRSGDTGRAATVDYATGGNNSGPCSTANGAASSKCDFTQAAGTLSFDVGDTSKTITLLISQDSFVEGSETFDLTLSNATNGAALGATSSTTVEILDDNSEPPTNVIDDANTFVRMHYHDFLNREGDQSGINFWTGQMTNCGASDLLVCRVNVSGAFFLSIEFQQTGYLVERMYRTAYDQATASSNLGGSHQVLVPIVRANEFLMDTQRIGRGVVVLQPGWEQVLENNKQAYALEFVQTTRFITALPTSRTPAQFVDQLNQNAGLVLSPSERTTAINTFGIAADTTNVNARAQVLRQIAEDQDLYNAEFSRAFVLAQYIGYLRRNPNDAPESSLDYTGYEFWLNKLNENGGDYIRAEMVKAFIASDEYRKRFGP